MGIDSKGGVRRRWLDWLEAFGLGCPVLLDPQQYPTKYSLTSVRFPCGMRRTVAKREASE